MHKEFVKPLAGELKKYDLLKARISEFNVFAKLSNRVKLISLDDIQTRCIVVDSGENLVLTPCVDLNEHD